MRPLSAAAKKAIFSQETSEVFLPIITIQNVGIGLPLRFVANSQDIVSRGNTYLACPFQLALPDDADQAPPRVNLTIDNVALEITEAIRALVTAPLLALEVILASSPDTIEAGPFNFTIRSAQYDATAVTAELVFEDVLNEPFPSATYIPKNFPGLF